MARESSGGDTKDLQEAKYKGETEVDEVLGKAINRRKSYNTAFLIGVIFSHEDIK